MTSYRVLVLGCLGIVSTFLAGAPTATDSDGSFVGPFNTVTTIASAVPKNRDVNPYGVAVVPASTGSLVQGNILVSNFNNHRNLQGTGSTIVQIAANGLVSTFSQLAPNKLPGPVPAGLG